MVTNLGVLSDIADRGRKCQKPRDTESPSQARRMTNLLSGSHASATSFPLQHVVCSNASWWQGPMGFALCWHDPTWKPAGAVLSCLQKLPRQARGACSPLLPFLLPACKIFQWFSTSSVVYPADLCTKNNLCIFAVKRMLAQVSQVPHQLLEQLWVLTEC